MKELFDKPPKNLDFKLILGSVIFGIGWGMSGLCPGVSYVTTAIMIP